MKLFLNQLAKAPATLRETFIALLRATPPLVGHRTIRGLLANAFFICALLVSDQGRPRSERFFGTLGAGCIPSVLKGR